MHASPSSAARHSIAPISPNEVAYHKVVNGALKSTLIPSATNAQLKALLETGLTLFTEHQAHAEHLATMLK